MHWRITSVVLFSALFASLVSAQTPASHVDASSNDDRTVEIQLNVSNPRNVNYPAALAERILRNTIHALALRLNGRQPPQFIGQIMLRLGDRGFSVETTQPKGQKKRTVITMERWDETLFARMTARAARDNLLADADLDDCARSGLAAARALADVTELGQAH